jgi:organic hydroperoxide reductase OsmC/OhrA
MIRKAKAVWSGTGLDGRGDLSTDSQVLNRTPYDEFASIAREAELNCPVSKVLKAEITLDAKLG